MRPKNEVAAEANELARQIGVVRYEITTKARHELQLLERLAQVDGEMGQILAAEKMVADAVAAAGSPPAPTPDAASVA